MVRVMVEGQDLQQVQLLAQEIASKPSESNASPANLARDKPRKLNNKEKRELDALPAKIEELETALRALHERMAESTYYKRNGSEIAEDKARLDAIEQELAVVFERWEALEALAG